MDDTYSEHPKWLDIHHLVLDHIAKCGTCDHDTRLVYPTHCSVVKKLIQQRKETAKRPTMLDFI